jgi:dihydrolipoamide dehydrogenase
VNADTVEVNGIQYQSKHFILAVGSTPTYEQKWKDELGDLLISSDQIFELEYLPKSLAVIGSGVIAIELAQAMQRLGVHVTIFARSHKVGSLTSPQLQKLAQQTLTKELNILFETLPESIKKVDNRVHISYQHHEKNHLLECDYVLVATGRKSLLSTLALENINASFDDLKKLPIDKNTKQLGNYPIFVVGDAHTSTPIQHEASHEGKMAVQNCLTYPKLNQIKTLTPLGIVFSEPEMASVGLSYKQLLEQDIDFVTGFVSYENQGRARVLAKNQGGIEIYVSKDDHKILGAELFCPSAEHMAHLLAWLIGEEVSLEDVLNKPFYHPTLEEGLRTAFKHARRQLK